MGTCISGSIPAFSMLRNQQTRLTIASHHEQGIRQVKCSQLYLPVVLHSYFSYWKLKPTKKKKFVLCLDIQSDLSSTFCRQFSCVFLVLLLSMLMMVFPAILPYFPSWKTAGQWQSNPLGIFGVHLDAPNWRLKRDAQWSLNLSTFLPLLHAPPPTTSSPFTSHSTDRFHFNFLPFSFLFFWVALTRTWPMLKATPSCKSLQAVNAPQFSFTPLLPSVRAAGSSQHVRKVYAWKASGKCCRL